MNTHRPCLFLALAFGVGIFLGHLGFFSWMVWSILSGLLIIASLFGRKFSSILLQLALICLGAFYEQHSYLYPKDHLAFISFNDQKEVSALEGVIDSEVQLKETSYGTKKVFEFQVAGLKLRDRWQKIQGRVLVNSFKDTELNYGDQLQIEGTLFKPKEDPKDRFSYRHYLEEHGLFFILSVSKRKTIEIMARDQGAWWMELSIHIRHEFKKILEKYLEPQEVSMIQAMTLGDRSLLSKDMYALFSKTGTSHILAISGMNMTIIGAMMLFLLKVLCFPRRLQLILTAIFLLCYAIVCGWSASVVRSVLMATVILSSFCVEYEAEGMNSLGVAALILLLLNPANLFDIGFQLSFICVFMIISTHPFFQSWIEEKIRIKFLRILLQAFLISIIAWIGITPLIAYYFNIVSLVSIVVNIPIVFLADLIMVLSLGLGVLGAFCWPLGIAFAGCLKLVFNLMLLIIMTFAQIPGGYVYVEGIHIGFIGLYYLILPALLIALSQLRKRFPN